VAMAYPEAVCLSRQMQDALTGKRIAGLTVEDVEKHGGSWRLGSITQTPEVFERLAAA